MTLSEIMIAALQQLGQTTDAKTIEVWRPKFTQLANEGMLDLARAIALRRSDALTANDAGEISVFDLPYECTKVLDARQNGSSVTCSKGSATGRLLVGGSGETTVEYRYVPPDMVNDTDKPGIPDRLHHLIVLYITAREHSTANVDTQSRYNALYQMYLAGRAEAEAHYGEPEWYQLRNVEEW